MQTRSSSKTFGLLLFRPLRGHLPLKGKAWGLRRTTKGFPLRGSCRRSRLMRRSVVRSELSPRFGKAKAPLGDQGELSAKLTERIRTLLSRQH